MTASTKDALANPGYCPIRLLPGAMPQTSVRSPNAERVWSSRLLVAEVACGGGCLWRRLVMAEVGDGGGW
jgi:hypothetical protein